MITVWRRVHIEVDSLGFITGNNITGTINGTVMIPQRVGMNPGTAFVNITREPPIGFTHEFRPGRLVIGSTSFRVGIEAGSTSNTIQVLNDGPRTVTINDLSNFVLYDDDDFDDDDGFIFDGDNAENIPGPNIDLLQSSDVPCIVETNGKVNNLCNLLLPAYVIPKYDLTGNENTPFDLNLDSTEFETTYNEHFDNIDTEASTDFWTIYFLGAYQYVKFLDGDPDGGNPIWGIAANSVGMAIFHESNRPTEYNVLNTSGSGADLWQNRPVGSKYTSAHEVGHLFGASEDDCQSLGINSGVMTGILRVTLGIYCVGTITKIRGGTGILHP
jgi:hypothetical protein